MPSTAAVALVLEDEPLIAFDIEMTLREAGFDVTTVASCEEAFEWLSVCRPDIAIVDIILRDGPCYAVVEQISADGVPFIVHTGEHPSLYAGTVLSKGTWLGKPSDGAAMVRTARRLAQF